MTTAEEADQAPPRDVRAPAGTEASEEQLHAVFRQLGHELRRAESAVAALVRDRTPDDGRVRVETVDGPAAQARRILELETGARHTFQAFLTGLNRITPVSQTLSSAPDTSADYRRAPPESPTSSWSTATSSPNRRRWPPWRNGYDAVSRCG